MTLPLPTYLDQLEESGVLTRGEVDELLSSPQFPADSSQELERLLIQQQRMTEFQAQMIARGKGHRLRYGKYLILERISSGGRNDAYVARHLGLKRKVALKLLPVRMLMRPGAPQRFLREVETLGRLRHPNIVEIHDADTHRGRLFYVTEYFDGVDLSKRVHRDGPLSVAEAVDCIVQAARGLAAVHALEIVHRDVRPSHLLVDAKGTVKVLDMASALVEQGVEDHARLTRKGLVLGAADYMPPEQSLDARRVDARADIYSLGCTLYFLLTGRPPYSGETAVERMSAHHHQPIPSLLDARPDVPEALDEIFQRMIAKSPDDRVESMAVLLTELERRFPDLITRRGGPPPESIHADDSAVLVDTLAGFPELSGEVDSVRRRRGGGSDVGKQRNRSASFGVCGRDLLWLSGAVMAAVLALVAILARDGFLPSDQGRVVLEFPAPLSTSTLILLDDVPIASGNDEHSRFVVTAPADGKTHRLRVESPDAGTLYEAHIAVSGRQTVHLQP